MTGVKRRLIGGADRPPLLFGRCGVGRWGWVGSGGVEGPAAGVVGQMEGGESGEVGGGGQEGEVCADAFAAVHAGAAAAVAAAHEVGEFAFDFGAGGPVVGLPDGVALADAGFGEVGFPAADGDLPSGFRGGALFA